MSLKFVYSNASDLGGVKIGGSWIFTQEGLENAISRRIQMAGKSNISGSTAHKLAHNKKGGYRLGKLKTKGAKEERKTLATRAGLAHFLQ